MIDDLDTSYVLIGIVLGHRGKSVRNSGWRAILPAKAL